MRVLNGAIALVLLGAAANAASITVAGNSQISSWGVTNTATYGQTFIAEGSQLTDFTFYLGNRVNGSGNIQYRAYLYQWDGAKATGSAIWQSATSALTPAVGSFAVSHAPNAAVTNGAQYVLFFSTSGLQSGQPGSQVSWSTNLSNVYSGGSFVFLNNGDTFSSLTTNNWNTYSAYDVQMNVNFDGAGVPEPSTYAMMGAGLAALVALRARRRS